MRAQIEKFINFAQRVNHKSKVRDWTNQVPQQHFKLQKYKTSQTQLHCRSNDREVSAIRLGLHLGRQHHPCISNQLIYCLTSHEDRSIFHDHLRYSNKIKVNNFDEYHSSRWNRGRDSRNLELDFGCPHTFRWEAASLDCMADWIECRFQNEKDNDHGLTKVGSMYSNTCCMEKMWSIQPRPCRKPAWFSQARSLCQHYLILMITNSLDAMLTNVNH